MLTERRRYDDVRSLYVTYHCRLLISPRRPSSSPKHGDVFYTELNGAEEDVRTKQTLGSSFLSLDRKRSRSRSLRPSRLPIKCVNRVWMLYKPEHNGCVLIPLSDRCFGQRPHLKTSELPLSSSTLAITSTKDSSYRPLPFPCA